MTGSYQTAADFLAANGNVADIAPGSLADQLNMMPEALTGGTMILAGLILLIVLW